MIYLILAHSETTANALGAWPEQIVCGILIDAFHDAGGALS
uniref:Uncharacterized protein n=1 Tax=Candidatus Kentrum sp. DK TaxID=2126562 RepID=A0A450TFV7_9GAMM|nr:MAG: hypothetical protein BECKDK2373C_GA0170839_11403 [Candidatus Kentron sp. DK]